MGSVVLTKDGTANQLDILAGTLNYGLADRRIWRRTDSTYLAPRIPERLLPATVLWEPHTVALCPACAVAVVNDDYSMGADAEVIQAFYAELGRGDRHLVWCVSIEGGFNGVCNACWDHLEYSTASIFTLV